MVSQALTSICREMVDFLVRKEYELAVERCSTSRLSSEVLRDVVADYGRRLVSPPSEAYRDLDAIALKGTPVQTWSVAVPLWSEEEGRSDLTLELTIALSSSGARVEIDDLHVL